MSLKDKALLVKLTQHSFTTSVRDVAAGRVVDQAYQTTNEADVYKRLFKGVKEFNAIQSKLTEQYQFNAKYTLPWMDGGFRILPSKFYETYIDKMGQFKTQLQSCVEALRPIYSDVVQKDIERLKGMANPQDYPPFESLVARIGSDVSIFPLSDSSDFRVEVDQTTKEKLDTDLAETSVAAKRELYKRVEKLVGVIVEQCSKEEPRLFDSMLENVTDLAEVMDILNVHDDVDVAGTAEKLRELTGVYNMFQLRNSANQRKDLAARAEKLITGLSLQPQTFVVEMQACEQSVSHNSISEIL